MKKTAKQWLMGLKDEHRNMAIANMEEGAENDEYSCLSMALSMSCHVWRNTPQGYDFWREIFEQISSGTYFDAPQLTEESCGEAARKTMYGLPKRIATDEDYEKLDELTAALPKDAAERKKYAVYSGFINYFPHAIAAVSHLSYLGNLQHHPDKPLHWDMDKSSDERDAMMRHVIDGDWEQVAWRAMSNLERKLTGKCQYENAKKEAK